MARVLSVSAHPDDDHLFAGGLLAKLAGEGHEVVTLLTTRGEGGEVGEPPVGPKERLGELREVEAREAARALGEVDVLFLDFVDPHMEIDGIAMPIDASMDALSGAIAAHLERLWPVTVITHGRNGEYGHPQHRFTHQAVREAIRRLSPWRPRQFITWMARTEQNAHERLTNVADPADMVLDVTPWFEQKYAAALAHRSQHAMFVRNSQQPTVRDMVRRIETYRHWKPQEI